MFEIENDNGKFIYPNRKMHIGVVDIEIINDTYFNIDSKYLKFDIEENFRFKIASKRGEPISRSKSLRIETTPFDLPDEARNAINIYIDSLRIILLKSGFSYQTPLISKVEEVPDPRCCVGIVEIKLQNDERLKIKGKERYHNENGSWYRLYSTQGTSISESDSLCIESSAYEESEIARQSIDAISPKFEAFLTNNSINFH